MGLAFGLPKLALGVLVLQVATPVAVTSYMLAAKYRARPDEVAGLVVVSTLLSVPAIPLFWPFLSETSAWTFRAESGIVPRRRAARHASSSR